jgi:hypothetical protein
MITADVEAIGSMFTGISSPWMAACSMAGSIRWVGDSCAYGPWRVAMWWMPLAKNSSVGSVSWNSSGSGM